MDAVKNNITYLGQQTSGNEVEFFSPETGFILLKRETEHDPWKAYVQRAAKCAELSLGAKLELREFYYTMLQTPHLIEPFTNLKPETIYGAILDSINDMEILADIDRDDFTMGNLSRGFIFDAHSWSYYNKEKKVGFTETIARTLERYELEATQNVLVIEKNAAATRLVELGISELTNSMIVTVGGNFNRAIWALTERMKNHKNLLFMCDADVYGDDMLRTIEFGTMNSRHLPFKFPPTTWKNIYLTGLFPSIGERLGFPNDIEQRRPLSNPYAQKRLEFLERYNLMDQVDIETWRRNKTYELEALSTAFKNEKGEPVGLGIYVIEFMRIHNIPIKPPLPPDEELKRLFDEQAREELRVEIETEVTSQSPKEQLISLVQKFMDEKIRELIDEIYERFIDDLEECLESVGPKEIKFQINKQYQENPKRRSYDLKELAHKLKTVFDVTVNWNAEEIVKIVEGALEDYIRQLSEAGKLWDADVEFTPLENEEEQKDVYDMALEEIGADPEDAKKVREALTWRFGREK